MTYGMSVCYVILLLVIVWYPGFMLARNMVKAVTRRNPTSMENVLSCIPGVNIGVARTALYGSAKIVYIPLACVVIATAIRCVLYYVFPEAILLGLYSLVVTWIVFGIAWLINGYVLWDMGTCIQAGVFTKLLGFVCPPLAQWVIGSNCIPLMASILNELETERQREDYIGYSNQGR